MNCIIYERKKIKNVDCRGVILGWSYIIYIFLLFFSFKNDAFDAVKIYILFLLKYSSICNFLSYYIKLDNYI